MNRPSYFNYIVSKLSALATEIELHGKLNFLDLHLQSENYYLFFFNDSQGQTAGIVESGRVFCG
ncbi:MAG TPA: hypothetical protein DER40_02400 [Geobacter sp.]|nr:hypothetical protein [Geobacter sp.]